WLIGGFVVQIIVAIIELKEGNTVGGNVFLFFSAFFMLVSGLEMLMKWWCIQHNIAFDARLDGWAWMTLAISLILWTPGYMAGPLSMCLAVFALDPAVLIVALKDLGVLSASWGPAAGVLLLIGGIFGLYTAAAIVLNTRFGKTVLPMGPPLIKG
ncbi:MAG: acetate uptake transporter family protein, partial [Chitinophagales bacterium]